MRCTTSETPAAAACGKRCGWLSYVVWTLFVHALFARACCLYRRSPCRGSLWEDAQTGRWPTGVNWSLRSPSLHASSDGHVDRRVLAALLFSHCRSSSTCRRTSRFWPWAPTLDPLQSVGQAHAHPLCNPLSPGHYQPAAAHPDLGHERHCAKPRGPRRLDRAGGCCGLLYVAFCFSGWRASGAEYRLAPLAMHGSCVPPTPNLGGR